MTANEYRAKYAQAKDKKTTKAKYTPAKVTTNTGQEKALVRVVGEIVTHYYHPDSVVLPRKNE